MAALLTNEEIEHNYPLLTSIATELAVSESTLRRLLARKGMGTYQRLGDPRSRLERADADRLLEMQIIPMNDAPEVE